MTMGWGAIVLSERGFHCSQITYSALRLAWQADATPIYLLISRCANAGFHPLVWRKTIAVALRKPGKADYSNPRAYRLIQLEECLGKVLEAIIARRLSSWIHTRGLVPPTQFGGRPARNHGLVTSSLTFDIKGHFDFVNHNKLANILRQKNLPIPIVKWVSSFPANREASICLDGQLSPSTPVMNGIPQGSPVSPALYPLRQLPIRILSTVKIAYHTTRITTIKSNPRSPAGLYR